MSKAKVIKFPSEPEDTPEAARAILRLDARHAISMEADDEKVRAVIAFCADSGPARILPFKKEQEETPEQKQAVRAIRASIVGLNASGLLVDVIIALGEASQHDIKRCLKILTGGIKSKC